MFLEFFNFYYQFIQGFNKIIGLLTFILKTNNQSKYIFISEDLIKKDNVINSNKSSEITKNLSKFQKSKNLTKTKNFIVLSYLDINIKITGLLIFTTSITFT